MKKKEAEEIIDKFTGAANDISKALFCVVEAFMVIDGEIKKIEAIRKKQKRQKRKALINKLKFWKYYNIIDTIQLASILLTAIVMIIGHVFRIEWFWIIAIVTALPCLLIMLLPFKNILKTKK